MNFLGHCYLCQDHTHLITGNLGGDFYKGKLTNHEHLPKNLQQGILLHRFIDDYTDNSIHTRQVVRLMRENGIQKVGGIACDILLDHYLSKNWSRFSPFDYHSFVQLIYAQVEADAGYIEAQFSYLFGKMREYAWFYEYPTIEGISLILNQFSRRVGFDNALDQSTKVYLNNQKTIDHCFETFLTDIRGASQQFILDQRLHIS